MALIDKIFLLGVLLAFSQNALAQSDSVNTKTESPELSFSGFLDTYYAYDFNKPVNHERPSFLYNHNRHNEFNVNLALLKAAYASDNVRGNLAFMAGTYAQYNLAAEPELLRNIYEANAGLKLSKGLWLDAGIFTSHIGLESAISKDNYTLTRSLAAENSPYYETGVKLTYELSGKWLFSGMVLNGWQNIREPEGNSNKAIGTQVQFKPTAHILLNSSTFIGNEKPDNAKQMRYFHDFYATFRIRPNFKLATVFDIGLEEKLNAKHYNIWYSPGLLLHYDLTKKFGLGARTEYYHDPNNVIIMSTSGLGFKMGGYSLNLDYSPTSKVALRVEGRSLHSKSAIFTTANKVTDNNAVITASLAFSL